MNWKCCIFVAASGLVCTQPQCLQIEHSIIQRIWAVFHLCFSFEIQDLVDFFRVTKCDENNDLLQLQINNKATVIIFTRVRNKMPHWHSLKFLFWKSALMSTSPDQDLDTVNFCLLFGITTRDIIDTIDIGRYWLQNELSKICQKANVGQCNNSIKATGCCLLNYLKHPAKTPCTRCEDA